MTTNITYIASARNGYHVVDQYRGPVCVRTAVAGLTNAKMAEHVAGELNEAHRQGRKELVGAANIAWDSNLPDRDRLAQVMAVINEGGAL
jgi:hypothetical protein